MPLLSFWAQHNVSTGYRNRRFCNYVSVLSHVRLHVPTQVCLEAEAPATDTTAVRSFTRMLHDVHLQIRLVQVFLVAVHAGVRLLLLVLQDVLFQVGVAVKGLIAMTADKDVVLRVGRHVLCKVCPQRKRFVALVAGVWKNFQMSDGMNLKGKDM